MVQYRKSKKVGPFRVTASGRGISTSLGYGPVRVTRRADGRYQQTVRIPGTGIRSTKIVGQRQASPATGDPNIVTQVGKLFLCLFGLAVIISVISGSLAVGFGIMSALTVALIIAFAVLLIRTLNAKRSGNGQ